MDAPYLDHDFPKASEKLRLAVAWLGERSIPPTPFNYRVAYDYLDGAPQELKSAVRERVEQTDSHAPTAIWEIYREFYLDNEDTPEHIRYELLTIIRSLQTEFEHSSVRLGRYNETLQRFVSRLENDPQPSSVLPQVQEVRSDTRSVAQSHHALHANMAGVITEVEALRKELQQVRQESLMDALTGVSNRKAFDAALEQSVYEAREANRPLSLALVDIDHFKRFNDNYGHLVGDKVLRFVASTLKRSLKGQDMVARFGGEEFAVLFSNTELRGAQTASEQVRSAVSAGSLHDRDRGERYGRVTVSLGVAQLRANELPEHLVARADQALYRAKTSGRNRVEADANQNTPADN